MSDSSALTVVLTVGFFVPLWLASQYFSITNEMTDRISAATACLRYVGILVFLEILVTQIASNQAQTTSAPAATTKKPKSKSKLNTSKQNDTTDEAPVSGIWLFFRAVTKGLASTAFVMTALHTIGSERLINTDINDTLQLAHLLIVGGLVLGWLGDMLLLTRTTFLAGLVAFLLGHIAYVGAFVVSGLNVGFTQVGAVLVIVQGIPIAMWLLPKVSRPMKVPVVAYVLVITAMVITAIGAYGHAFFAELPPHVQHIFEYVQADHWRLVSATGSAATSPATSAAVPALLPSAFRRLLAAEMFYLSDICVARNKFVHCSCWNQIVGLPLYYIAQLLFAASLMY
jgi:uncharacterized membrane protein YhhN